MNTSEGYEERIGQLETRLRTTENVHRLARAENAALIAQRKALKAALRTEWARWDTVSGVCPGAALHGQCAIDTVLALPAPDAPDTGDATPPTATSTSGARIELVEAVQWQWRFQDDPKNILLTRPNRESALKAIPKWHLDTPDTGEGATK